jgi:hypothetical protein
VKATNKYYRSATCPERLFHNADVDQIGDDVGLLCRELRSGVNWTAERHEIKKRLVLQLRKDRYVVFSADPRVYGLSRIGESFLLEVSAKQRGHLKPFRGKLIRLVCMGSGRFKRVYAARSLMSLREAMTARKRRTNDGKEGWTETSNKDNSR